MQNDVRYELYNVLFGKSQVRYGRIIQTIASYLKDSETASETLKSGKHFKSEETKNLEKFITLNNLWVREIDFSKYVSEGAEQKVYLKDSKYVLKLNDSIYYTSWKDYLYNLLLHNYF
ncbi:hypothetical protein SAMN05444372_101382 [Flavobacterium micromati]|uniref:Uncharacterized protein n=1 Tax=Flavobacterium micromati TaxID=229205 RepID=A0A1M5G011_9FLAO|nr:hypothetical protein SAMN05444372_101382 [Flavobacterium micromati]